MLRQRQDFLKVAGFKLLLKLAAGLLDHLHEINIHIFQRDIARTYFGCLYHILCQGLKPLGLSLQHFQISLNLRIFKILLLQKFYIINDRSKRRLDIMGYIRDQVRLEALALHAFLKCRVQSFSDRVDALRDIALLISQAIYRDLVIHLSAGYLLNSLLNPLPANCLPDQEHKCHSFHRQGQEKPDTTSHTDIGNPMDYRKQAKQQYNLPCCMKIPE